PRRTRHAALGYAGRERAADVCAVESGREPEARRGRYPQPSRRPAAQYLRPAARGQPAVPVAGRAPARGPDGVSGRRLLRLPERRVQPDRRHHLRGHRGLLLSPGRNPPVPPARHEDRDLWARRARGIGKLGEAAPAPRPFLEAVPAERDVLPRRTGGRRQCERTRHGTMADRANGRSPRCAVCETPGEAAYATGRDHAPDAHLTMATLAPARCAIRTRLAGLRLFRRDADLSCRSRAGLSDDDRLPAEVPVRPGHALEQRIRAARRPDADALRRLSGPAGNELGGHRTGRRRGARFRQRLIGFAANAPSNGPAVRRRTTRSDVNRRV